MKGTRQDIKIVPFDSILFNLVRLDIVGNLYGEPSIPFKELRNVLAITDGNLASHLRALERHGIVQIHKGFIGKKVQTTIELTSKGREDFDNLKTWFYHAFIEGG